MEKRRSRQAQNYRCWAKWKYLPRYHMNHAFLLSIDLWEGVSWFTSRIYSYIVCMSMRIECEESNFKSCVSSVPSSWCVSSVTQQPLGTLTLDMKCAVGEWSRGWLCSAGAAIKGWGSEHWWAVDDLDRAKGHLPSNAPITRLLWFVSSYSGPEACSVTVRVYLKVAGILYWRTGPPDQTPHISWDALCSFQLYDAAAEG